MNILPQIWEPTLLDVEMLSNSKDAILETDLQNKSGHKHIIQKYGANFLSLLSNSVSSQPMMNTFPHAEREMV